MYHGPLKQSDNFEAFVSILRIDNSNTLYDIMIRVQEGRGYVLIVQIINCGSVTTSTHPQTCWISKCVVVVFNVFVSVLSTRDEWSECTRWWYRRTETRH